TGARDAAIWTQEYHRLLMGVEPGFEASGTIAHDHDVGIIVPGPVQLSQRTGGDELRSQCLPCIEGFGAKYLSWIVVPAQYGEPTAQYVVEQDILLSPSV